MTAQQIKAYYNLISEKSLPDSEIRTRVEIIRIIERETGLEFKDTADFHSKVRAFIDRASDIGGIRLREDRQRRGWTIDTLAKILDISTRHLSRMESGQVSLSPSAFAFLHGDVNGKTESRIRRIGGADGTKNGHPATTPLGA